MGHLVFCLLHFVAIKFDPLLLVITVPMHLVYGVARRLMAPIDYGIADDEIVAAAIAAGDENCDSWWITKHGTVLIFHPDVVLYVGLGRPGLKFGVGMPPVWGRNDIAGIPISFRDKNLLWAAFKRIKLVQLAKRKERALATVGRQS